MRYLAVFLGLFLLAACNEEKAELPQPEVLDEDCIGYYCNMIVANHPGPKAHIFLRGQMEPVWFSSVRDAIAYTMLPEEPRAILVIWVHDMAKSPNWDKPEPNTWMKAEEAVYVIGSSKRGGMGAPEAVPFSDQKAAEAFAARFGGRVVPYKDVTADYIFGDVDEQTATSPDGASLPKQH